MITLTINGTKVELTCRGTPEALEELRRAATAGELAIWVEVKDLSGAVQQVDSKQFEWAEGKLPPGIERSSLSFKPDRVVYRVEIESEDGGEE